MPILWNLEDFANPGTLDLQPPRPVFDFCSQAREAPELNVPIVFASLRLCGKSTPHTPPSPTALFWSIHEPFAVS